MITVIVWNYWLACMWPHPLFRSVFVPLRKDRGMFLLIFPLRGWGAYWGQIHFTQWARVHPGWFASSSKDPYWWQCHARCQLHIRSNVPSRILRHVAQSQPRELGFEPAIFWSLINQLNLVSYSRPLSSCTCLQYTKVGTQTTNCCSLV